MKKILILLALTCLFSTTQAQRLSFEQLEQMLNQSIDQAEESLFLLGYSFSGEKSDSSAMIYSFSNQKNTVGTAKRVTKAVYKKPLESYLKYITYDRSEFEALRKLMIEYQFVRQPGEALSENSNFSNEHLKVNFQVTTDKYENSEFVVTLRNTRLIDPVKAARKLNLREMINNRFKRNED